MPIYMNSYIKCVFNRTYIFLQICMCMYLADTGLSADTSASASVLKSLLTLVCNVCSCNFTILAFCTFSMCHQPFVVVDIVGN